MAVSDVPVDARPGLIDRFYAWRTALIGSRGFQRVAARVPFASTMARRDGEALFDLVAGFVHSQVLAAFVDLDMPARLTQRPKRAEELALETGLPPVRMQVLCQAAASLKLLSRRRDGRYGLGRLGAALPGVPGLSQMIAHHDVLYRDLSDARAFFADGSRTELAAFWPYVFGATGEVSAETAATYSELMAQSQTLVAEEALAALDLSQVTTLLDVGGGTGAFLTAAGLRNPRLRLHLFDLPVVIDPAASRFARHGLSDRATITGGSFRTDALPSGADAISLVRVLYDHSDDTVRMLLSKAHAALADGGRLIVAEPMSGGAAPMRATDAYFGIYCMAMRTGRVRSAEEIGRLLKDAGFADIRTRRTARPFITSVVTAEKP